MLWKCWRDLRVTFCVGVGWLALLAISDLWHLLRSPDRFPTVIAGQGQAVQLVMGYVMLQTVIFTLLALSMGTNGIGRDIAGGSGSFLLTRPVPRERFVWSEWFSGLSALGVLLLAAVAGLWITAVSHAFRVIYTTTMGPATTTHTWTLGSLPGGFTAIEVLCGFLFLALVFSLTHLGTVAFRHSTAGLMFCLGTLVGWLIATAVLRHEYPWMAAYIPDLLLRPYGSDLSEMRLVPHVAEFIVARAAILPVFPLVGWWFLKRAEV